MSAGEVPDRNQAVTNELLRRERHRTTITRWLGWISIVLVVVFYLCLLYFLFWGGLRHEAWIWSVTDGARFALSDLPDIVVLSMVPTLILITLLRHYRVQPAGQESKDDKDDSVSPLAMQLCKELIKESSKS